MTTETPIVVTTFNTACDGGNGALGHPKVYLSLKGKREIKCPYCGKQFVLAEESALEGAH